MDELSNAGMRAVSQRAYEKPCQHSYAEGSLVRIMPDTRSWEKCPFIGISPQSEPNRVGLWIDLSYLVRTDLTKDVLYHDDPLPFRVEIGDPEVGDDILVFYANTVYYQADVKLVRIMSQVMFYISDQYGQVHPVFWVFDASANIRCSSSACDVLVDFRLASGEDWWLKEPRWTFRPEAFFPWVEHYPVGRFPWGAFDVKSLLNTTKASYAEHGVYRNASRDEAIWRSLEAVSVCQINPIELYRDLKDPKQALQTLLDVSKWLKHPDKTYKGLAKVMACLHLWWKYVVKTGLMSLSNLQDIARYVGERSTALWNEIHSLELEGRGKFEDEVVGDFQEDQYEITRTYSSKVVYQAPTNSISGWFDTLNALGFTPHLSDLWDIVKYSFVLDWVVKVDRMVERMEITDCMQRIPLTYLLLGYKRTLHCGENVCVGADTYPGINPQASPPPMLCSMDMTFVDYERKLRTELPDDMWFGRVFGDDPLKHAVTAAALVVQYVVKGD
jgi:hypothetical protein